MYIRKYVDCKSDDKTDINGMVADIAKSIKRPGSFITLDAQRMQTTSALIDAGIDTSCIYIAELNRKVYRAMVDRDSGVHVINCDILELVQHHRRKISVLYLDYMGNTEILDNFRGCIKSFSTKRTKQSMVAITFSCRFRTKGMTFKKFLENDVMPIFAEHMPNASVQTKCVLGYMRTVGSPMAHCQYLIDWGEPIETEYWPNVKKCMWNLTKEETPQEFHVPGVANYDKVTWYAFPHHPTYEPAGVVACTQ